MAAVAVAPSTARYHTAEASETLMPLLRITLKYTQNMPSSVNIFQTRQAIFKEVFVIVTMPS